MRLTHAWNAARLVEEHGHELRYVESLNSWICFDGARWRLDRGLSAKRLAKRSAHRIFEEAAELQGDAGQATLRWARRSLMASGVSGTIDLAKPDLEISAGKLDAGPMLLNVANGTLDLRTHELRPHDPADLITKVAPTPYEPGARCERWERFLEEVLPDPEVRAFFQRLMGYALQGGQAEKAFGIVHGPPDGGKSTAINACARALGTSTRDERATDDDDSAVVTRHYAEGTSISTFGAQRGGGGNRPELAKLMGARLVVVNEIKGEALESSVMKAWTGGDLVSATPKYGHPLGFYADGTVILVGNELPEIEFEDDAMWGRVAVVPFTVTIPEERRDRNLASRFDPRAVLAWMVEGHRQYQEAGLSPPPLARLAKEAHRSDSDPLADFWRECVEVVDVDPRDREAARVSTHELYHRYEEWAIESGVPPRERLSKSKLTRTTNKRSKLTGEFGVKGTGHWRGWEGIRLVEEQED
jgi:putative DNA primase/helicase